MAKIEIYARLRPTSRRCDGIDVTEDSDNKYEHILVLPVKHEGSPVSTPSKRRRPYSIDHTFQFKRVFQEAASQEEVFDTVAKNIIDSFLEGYNATIFAYGQTSSGKTYTIEGNGQKYSDRGIIPRSLSYIYKEIEKRTSSGEDVSLHISYMEIYQDTGYDLLNPGMRPGALMVTLPKINISEGPGGRVIIRNLSSHLAASEEVAQSLLFQGSTCRKVAETSMNQCSSRSHSIFSITLTAKSTDSEIFTRSKLNLVDLAGSERVSKTRADGRILQEAKHINLSLHHLEHVIVTLQTHLKSSQFYPSPLSSPSTNASSRKSRERFESPHASKLPGSLILNSRSTILSSRKGHVPYRNCMLTMVLKDSLGGNCLTAMIATISVEENNIGETISTLRFSQRVACISNKARKNEELDDKVVIKKLKQRIIELENEVLTLKNQHKKGEQHSSSDVPSSTSLTDHEKIFCHQTLYQFFHGKIDNPVTAGINTVEKFNECLQVLKNVVLQALGVSQQSSSVMNTDAKELTHQMRESFLPSTTPSPNSRLSSGFGSLADTDKIYDSSHTNATPPVATGEPVHPSPPSIKDQLYEQRLQKKKGKKVKQSEHCVSAKSSSVHRSHSKQQKPIAPSTQAHPNPMFSDKSPKHARRAWISPSSSQSFTPAKPSSVPSIREERETKQLLCKKEELKRTEQEQQKLLSQVQLLDLHVEEEKLKSEVDCISEQLAMQHAMVTKLQKSECNWEKLCAEKIAEQQLRIKQAKMHQKLMDVHYYIEHCQRPPSSPVPSTIDLEPPSLAKNTVKMQRELESHELKQTQVTSQIEQLKISQMEKQLELKEASTRRKILALKQKLLTGTPPSQLHSNTTRQSQPQATHIQSTESIPAAKTYWQRPSMSQSAESSSKVSKSKANSVVTPQLDLNSAKAISLNWTPSNKNEGIQILSPNKDDAVNKARSIDTEINTSSSNSDDLLESSSKVKHTVCNVGLSPKSPSPSTVCSSSPRPSVKLTLPEEIKETEYMTAVQKQKARVSKIRRCIVAATLIQRAWRTHKNSKSVT